MSAFIKRNWFTLAIPTVIGASCVAPDFFRSGGRLSYQDFKSPAVSTMFMCSGICIPGFAAFRGVMSQHKRNFFIQGTSLIAIPLIVGLTAPTFVSLLGLPDAVTTGATFVACLPTTVGLSVALTKAAGGSVLLSTFHSALGNAIGPFVTPVSTALLVGLSAQTDAMDIFKKLGSLIVLPLGAGLALRSMRPTLFATPRATRIAGVVQQLCLLTMLSNVFSTSFHKRLQQEAEDERRRHAAGDTAVDGIVHSNALPWSTVGTIAFLMASYHTAFFLGTTAMTVSFPAIFGGAETSIAAVYCATQKTAAMGIAMVDMLFQGHDDLDLIVAPLLLYHMYQIFFGAMIGQHILKRYCAKVATPH
jgi:solute carrier family 10 (sodium/bile acid cotransporter), member 7